MAQMLNYNVTHKPTLQVSCVNFIVFINSQRKLKLLTFTFNLKALVQWFLMSYSKNGDRCFPTAAARLSLLVFWIINSRNNLAHLILHLLLPHAITKHFFSSGMYIEFITFSSLRLMFLLVSGTRFHICHWNPVSGFGSWMIMMFIDQVPGNLLEIPLSS